MKSHKNKKSYKNENVHYSPAFIHFGAFFDLLLQIDKRNHPELYEHNQSGVSATQATK